MDWCWGEPLPSEGQLRSPQHLPLPGTAGEQDVSEWDTFPSPGSFPRTPEPLAQGPISLLTLEKQYLHPRAL
uniref:Uncharacterized protein n=1 Tax=Cyanistes caeruleus TaxID=156563 RepID=A0A8C0UF19_CYACU